MEPQQPHVSLPASPTMGWSGGGDNANTSDNSRMFCPVAECPDSLTSSTRYFRTFASIKIHLNDHCTGQLNGAVPVNFLRHFDYTQCRVCDKILHKKYLNSTCPKCRPAASAQDQILQMRNRATTSATNAQNGSQIQNVQVQENLPSLSEIHKKYIPTIKTSLRVFVGYSLSV